MEERQATGNLSSLTGVKPGARAWSLDLARLRNDMALRDALFAAGCCFVLVLLSGTIAWLIFPSGDTAGVLDPPGLVEHLGSSLKDTLAAPFARWDAAWYLTAAIHGYGHPWATATFFPLYPLLIAIGGSLGIGYITAGVLISVVSFVIGLRMIWLLTRLEFGAAYPNAPRYAVLITALFPTAFFLTAVFPEAFLLATSTSAIWFARKNKWPWAGLMGGLGAAAHSLGLLLAVPLGLLYLREHRWRLRPDVLWLALVPAGYAAFMLYLGLSGHDPLWPLYAHEKWQRFFVDPASGTWEATRAAFAGVQQLVSGQSVHAYWQPAVVYGYKPMEAAADNLELFGFFLLAIAAMIGAFRRLPLAYGAYIATVLVVVVSDPISAQPLSGLSRYVAVLFPVQMVLGRWLSVHRGWRVPVFALSIAGLVFYTGYFATWHWVA
jgi:hypothetical protein